MWFFCECIHQSHLQGTLLISWESQGMAFQKCSTLLHDPPLPSKEGGEKFDQTGCINSSILNGKDIQRLTLSTFIFFKHYFYLECFQYLKLIFLYVKMASSAAVFGHR